MKTKLAKFILKSFYYISIVLFYIWAVFVIGSLGWAAYTNIHMFLQAIGFSLIVYSIMFILFTIYFWASNNS